MPNHVTNKLTFEGEGAEAFILMMRMGAASHPDQGFMNFEALIPNPNPSDWYDHNRTKWGTKWNAYDQSDLTEIVPGVWEIRFDTAWNTPRGIWEHLEENFKDVKFTIYYADEDTGSNLGKIVIEEGEIDWEERSAYPDESKLEILNEIYGAGAYEICPKCDHLIPSDWECDYCEDA